MNQTNIASMKLPSGQGFHHGKEKTTVYVVGVYTTVRHRSGVPVRPTGRNLVILWSLNPQGGQSLRSI